MAITAQAPTWVGQGPTAEGQYFAAGGYESQAVLKATVEFTGDGSLAAATLNFIDGTKKLTFTPSAVVVTRIGGDAAATICGCCTANDDATATISFSAAPANGKKLKFFVALYK